MKFRVESWYDRSIRSWTSYVVDEGMNQVSDALHDRTRGDRDVAVRILEGQIESGEIVRDGHREVPPSWRKG